MPGQHQIGQSEPFMPSNVELFHQGSWSQGQFPWEYKAWIFIYEHKATSYTLYIGQPDGWLRPNLQKTLIF